MRLIAKHEVWVAVIWWRGATHLIADTIKPILPPYSGGRIIHLDQGEGINFTNQPTDSSNPYETVMEIYGEHFELKGDDVPNGRPSETL